MVRKVLTVTLVLGILSQASAAIAWSNGRSGPNSFGTHDWIVREGIRLAGRDSRWVCVRTALRATDDPDTRSGLDHASATWWHVWDEWGSTYGGAPEAVGVWFRKAQRAREAGRRCPASRALGIMGHLLGDVAQPMHTDGRLPAEDRVHASYEVAVDNRCTASSCRYRARGDGFDRSAPYARTRAVARAAHDFYAILVRGYDRHGYSRRVDQLTRRQLNRAANAMADLIRSM